jgi:exopolyphosphatase/guanosine-5'-triphosphate,3'-diphosphate pyrophosphatase
MNIAILDLGSTTFHLELFCVTADGGVAPVLDVKRTLCLGESVFRSGGIDEAARAEGLEAASELVARARSAGAERLVVVATSALREARNGDEFMRELERRVGLAVRVVGPKEEARLAFAGQALHGAADGRRVAVVDLGGGSVEIALGRGPRCESTESLPLGAVRLRAALPPGPLHALFQVVLADRIHAGLEPTCARVRRFAPEVVLFGSGSARAARSLATLGTASSGRTGPVDATTLRESVARHATLAETALVARGVHPRRASTVVVATSLMAEFLELSRCGAALVTDRGLRDGLALETYREVTHGRRAASALVWGLAEA